MASLFESLGFDQTRQQELLVLDVSTFRNRVSFFLMVYL